MLLGICGWSQCGKTTVFEALTGASKVDGDHSAKSHVGVCHVADERVDFLSGVFKPKKTTYATVEYVDLPALVTAGHSHETNAKTLADVRQADALIAVLRAFKDPTVPHPFGSVDPKRDFERLWDELVFADLEIADRRIERLEADTFKHKPLQKEDEVQLACLKNIKAALEDGKAASSVSMSDAEDKAVRGFRFLTAKPILVLLNRGEDAIGAPPAFSDADFGYPTVAMFGKLELELSQLAPEDRAAFMEDMGLSALAAPEIIRRGYDALRQISFFTVSDKEVHAWAIPRQTPAVEAAGAVHSDMQRGFIRAEVTAFDDFKALGSFKEARAKGKLRLEGKDYPVADGDIILFRFSV